MVSVFSRKCKIRNSSCFGTSYAFSYSLDSFGVYLSLRLCIGSLSHRCTLFHTFDSLVVSAWSMGESLFSLWSQTLVEVLFYLFNFIITFLTNIGFLVLVKVLSFFCWPSLFCSVVDILTWCFSGTSWVLSKHVLCVLRYLPYSLGPALFLKHEFKFLQLL